MALSSSSRGNVTFGSVVERVPSVLLPVPVFAMSFVGRYGCRGDLNGGDGAAPASPGGWLKGDPGGVLAVAMDGSSPPVYDTIVV
jgi:hypothetical protein